MGTATSKRILRLKTIEMDSDDLNEKREFIGRKVALGLNKKKKTPERPGTKGALGLPAAETHQHFFKGLPSLTLKILTGRT